MKGSADGFSHARWSVSRFRLEEARDDETGEAGEGYDKDGMVEPACLRDCKSTQIDPRSPPESGKTAQKAKHSRHNGQWVGTYH